MATLDTRAGPDSGGTSTPDRTYRLFQAALGVSPAARPAFLDSRCGQDARLRAELESLLAHDRLADCSDFLGRLLGEGAADHPARPDAGESLVGRRLGPYEVLGIVARGGMGAVYRAARVDDYAQMVAIKVVRADTLSESALIRFAAERQILAGLNHPNIARLLDGGTTPWGLPYAVQEFVDGTRIDRYADGERLGPRDRLRLLAVVCRAVEHAHRNGVIHRDLKPSNVLVDRSGQVKLVDFGLARALSPENRDLTATGEFLGTIAYMSPERLAGSGGRGDTRTDVYALGVIGYELLVGRPPVDVAGLGLGAAARAVCETEPTPLGAADRRFRGDLDAIFRSALAKEPDLRYPSAGALADDLERHLRGEPVAARTPSLLQTVRRVAGRHRAASLAGLMVLTTLVAALAAVSAALVHARHQETEATRQRERAEEGQRQARRAVDDMYTWVGARLLAREPGLSLERREFLEKALAHYQDFARDGGTEPEVRFKTAQAYYHVANIQDLLGRHAEAERAHREQISLLRRLAADFPAEAKYRFDLFRGLSGLAGAIAAQVQDGREMPLQHEALAVIESLAADVPGEPNYRDAVANQNIQVGHYLVAGGKLDEAERLARRALGVAGELARAHPNQRTTPYYAANAARALLLLGRVKTTAGLFEEAEAQYRDALRAGQELVDQHPEDPALVLELVGHQRNLVAARGRLGRFDVEGEELLVRAARAQDQLARDFPNLSVYVFAAAEVHRDLGYYLLATGQKERAEESLRQFTQVQERLVQKYPDNLIKKGQLAWFLAAAPAPLGNPARALALVEEMRRQSDDPTRGSDIVVVARHGMGEWKGSIEAFGQRQVKDVPRDGAVTFFAAMSYQALGETDRAREHYDRAVRWAGEGCDVEVRLVRTEAEHRLGITSRQP